MARHQYFAWDAAGNKRTSGSEGKLDFLASLPVGASVWEEREEWDYGQWWTVAKCIGEVVSGPHGNDFKRTARFY